ncbi:MAG: hypothetical protein QOF85_315 [Solirubrobacterales bacterium]|nr:hypothetical protein [Solirubrobacterales bacterium]
MRSPPEQVDVDQERTAGDDVRGPLAAGEPTRSPFAPGDRTDRTNRGHGRCTGKHPTRSRHHRGSGLTAHGQWGGVLAG